MNNLSESKTELLKDQNGKVMQNNIFEHDYMSKDSSVSNPNDNSIEEEQLRGTGKQWVSKFRPKVRIHDDAKIETSGKHNEHERVALDNPKLIAMRQTNCKSVLDEESSEEPRPFLNRVNYHTVNELSEGKYFGEISLMHNILTTASIH